MTVKKDKEEMKGSARCMKIRVVLTVLCTLALLISFTVPAFASGYRYTSTSFRFIGDILYQRIVETGEGSDKFSILVTGEGDVRGRQQIEISRSPVDVVYGKDSYDVIQMATYLAGTTSPTATADKKLRMISEIDLRQAHRSLLQTGVEMDPGETGYIDQNVTSSVSPGEGNQFLNIDNRFGNTGGSTRKNLEVTGFVSEQLRVDGYAEVTERVTIRQGKPKSGWWNMQW